MNEASVGYFKGVRGLGYVHQRNSTQQADGRKREVASSCLSSSLKVTGPIGQNPAGPRPR